MVSLSAFRLRLREGSTRVLEEYPLSALENIRRELLRLGSHHPGEIDCKVAENRVCLFKPEL